MIYGSDGDRNFYSGGTCGCINKVQTNMQGSRCSFHCTGKTENNVIENLGKFRGKVEGKSARLGTITNSETWRGKARECL